MTAAQPMEHPILGNLVPDKTSPETLTGRISFGAGDPIGLRISPDDKTLEAALALAALAIPSLEKIDAKCRKLVAKDFLADYNTDWRFGETVLADGKSQPFEKPPLTKAQFCMNLGLKSIEACGDSMLVLWYRDGDMFWGHSLEVTSFDGLAFKDTHVSMAG